MRVKLVFIGLCVLIFLNAFSSYSFSHNEEITLSIDGDEIEFKENEKPYLVKIIDEYHGNRVSYGTMVPLRTTFEALGAKVIWNNIDQTIDVSLNGVTKKFKVNNDTENMNYGIGLRASSDVTLKNNKTYLDIVQIKYVANYQLEISEDNKEIHLYNKDFSISIDGEKSDIRGSAGYLAYEINENGYNIKDPSKVFVSARNIFEYIGGKVTWDDKAKDAVINIDGKEIRVNALSYEIIVNGEVYPTKGDRAKFGRGRIGVDLGLVADILNYEIEWVQEEKTLYLNKK